jgi:hypothetical protein
MAKDLNTSNLGQIVMNGEEIFLGFEGAERAQVLPAGIGGTVIDGVFVATGDMAGVASIGREVKLPKTVKAREAFLRKWADKAAEKAKANKGLSATLLILPLAACGGGSDPAFEVAINGASGSDIVSFLHNTAKITVDIASGVATFVSGTEVASVSVSTLSDATLNVAAGQTLEVRVGQLQDASVTDGADTVRLQGAGDVRIVLDEGDHSGMMLAGKEFITETITVKVALSGGNLTFDLPVDDNDTIVLSAHSTISLGGGNLIVDDGVVDARLATITGANTIGDILVASELILTKAQYDAVSGDVTTSGDGKLTVFVSSLVEARDVIADDGSKIASAVNLTLEVSDNADLGALSVAQFVELRGLVDDLNGAIASRGVTFDIVDTAENLFRLVGINTGWKTGVEAILNEADSVTVTDEVNTSEKALLEGLTPGITYTGGADEVAPTIIVSVDVSSLLANQTAVVTFTLSEASINFVQNDVVLSGGASLASWQGPDETGVANVYKATLIPPTSTSGLITIRVNNQAFTDLVGNFNVDGADSNNLASININTYTFDVVVTGGVATFTPTAFGDIAPGKITFTVSGSNITFSKGGLSETVTGVTSIKLGDGQVLEASAAQLSGIAVTSAESTTAQVIITSSAIADLLAVDLDAFEGDVSYHVTDTASAILTHAELGYEARTSLLQAASVEVAGKAAGTLSLADFTELRALTTLDTWSYNLADTPTVLFGAVTQDLVGAGTVSFIGDASVTQANRVLTLNNTVSGPLSVADSADELARNSLVGNAANEITLTSPATVAQAQTIAGYLPSTLNWGPGVTDSATALLANAALFQGPAGALSAVTIVKVTANNAGELSVAEYLALKEITTGTDDWSGPSGSYTIRDTPQNLVKQALGTDGQRGTDGTDTDNDPGNILAFADAISFDGVPNLTQFGALQTYFAGGDFDLDLVVNGASAEEINDLNGIMSVTSGTITADITGTADILDNLQPYVSGTTAQQDLTISVTTAATAAQGAAIAASTRLTSAVDFDGGINDSFANLRNSDANAGGISSDFATIVAQDNFVHVVFAAPFVVTSNDDINDINAIIAATRGNITASLEGSASLFVGLTSDSTDDGLNHLSLELTDTTVSAVDLNTLLSKTTLPVNIASVDVITGTYAQIRDFYNNWLGNDLKFEGFAVEEIRLTGDGANATGSVRPEDFWVRCVFRGDPASDSESIGPPIPILSGH